MRAEILTIRGIFISQVYHGEVCLQGHLGTAATDGRRQLQRSVKLRKKLYHIKVTLRNQYRESSNQVTGRPFIEKTDQAREGLVFIPAILTVQEKLQGVLHLSHQLTHMLGKHIKGRANNFKKPINISRFPCISQ